MAEDDNRSALMEEQPSTLQPPADGEAEGVEAADEEADDDEAEAGLMEAKHSKSRFSVDQIRELMGKPEQIRNISVVAHVDHGKSTLTDQLVCRAGMIGEKQAGEMRYTDTRPDEQQRGITIKSTGVSLYFESSELPYLINLVDSPGHVDFSSEVTAALRVTDGALVVVDCVEGVRVQTETVLRQALQERIKPVLMLNKLDRPLLELHNEAEETYQKLCRTIEDFNVIASGFNIPEMGNVQVSPQNGTVCFGSGLQGWAFGLDKFANIYATKFGIAVEKMMEKLWGDHFFAPKTKKWTNSGEGNRAFCQFVLDPILQIERACAEEGAEKLQRMSKALGIQLKSDDLELKGKKLFKRTMQLWLPAADALLTLIVRKLPSPVVAQKYRVATLYEGPQDDVAANAVRNCDPAGPLMLFVSKLVPTEDKKRFYAFGRVFSGTVKVGQKVRVQGPDYEPSEAGAAGGPSKHDVSQKNVQRVVLMMGRYVESLNDAPAGTLVALVGVDQVIGKTATITTLDTAYNLSSLKFTVAPVVQISVKPKVARDLPKLVEAMRMLAKSDPLIICGQNESGEHIISGAGELHLGVCLRDLRREYFGLPFTSSKPVVTYRETVAGKSDAPALAKSSNKHNRLYVVAEPLGDELANAIESRSDFYVNRQKTLVSEFGWERSDAQRVWCFGPDYKGANCWVNQTAGAQYVQEISPHVAAAFQWASQQGPLCEEPMRGTRFNLVDVTLHTDAIHRGAGQIIPTTRRVMFGSALSSEPRLVEPFYRVDISCHGDVVSIIHRIVTTKRGAVLDEQHHTTDTMVDVVAELPVSESFGFATLLAAETSGRALAQSTFSHWCTMDGDPMCSRGHAAAVRINVITKRIRKRKGLSDEVPSAKDYVDKL